MHNFRCLAVWHLCNLSCPYSLFRHISIERCFTVFKYFEGQRLKLTIERVNQILVYRNDLLTFSCTNQLNAWKRFWTAQ